MKDFQVTKLTEAATAAVELDLMLLLSVTMY
jgi:hypothetical protein